MESLCDTSADSFGIGDFDAKTKSVSLTFREGKDIKGPLTVALVGVLTGSGEKKTEGRFVALGTSAIIATCISGFRGIAICL